MRYVLITVVSGLWACGDASHDAHAASTGDATVRLPDAGALDAAPHTAADAGASPSDADLVDADLVDADLVDGGASLDAGASGPRRVFVSSSSFTGALMDYRRVCARVASAAGLSGRWMTLLSTPDDPALARLEGEGPWVDMTGAMLFATRDRLLVGPERGILFDEFGRPLEGVVLAWTGTMYDGTVDPLRTCQSWTSSSAVDHGIAGASFETDVNWIHRLTLECNERRPVYCFEQP